ncbi:MAG: polyphosphate kinase, partial [Thalassobaculaceae bacterium]
MSANDNRTLEQPLMTIDPDSPDRFINRELSWLAFNFRVLEEARNPTYPLLERLRFVSISSSNLDEFQMVRVAGLKGQMEAGVSERSDDGRTPAQQLAAISQTVKRLQGDQQESFRELCGELAAAAFHLVADDALSAAERRWIEEHFIEQIFPALTPLAIDPAHPFPFIPNRGACVALQLSQPDGEEDLMALVPLPAKIPRFVRLPGPVVRFIAIEQVILMHLGHIFPNFACRGAGFFRVLRDSEMEIDEEAEDLVRSFESALRARRRGHVIALALNAEMPDGLKKFVIDQLQVSSDDVFELAVMVGLADLNQLITTDRSDLLWRPFTARFPERIRDFQGDCLAAIRAKDILVHHPYESFDVVLQFLRQAADDPNVIAIKQTLYRTTPNSPIVKALTEAA